MDKVRIGIIGFGRMGNQHTKALMAGKVDNAVLTCVADTNPEALRKGRELYGDSLKYFNTAEDLLSSGLVDAVIPTVPHYYHPYYAVKAFERGINYLCEKPAGVYTNQVKKMNEAAAKSGLVFGVMFNQRTNPVYQKAHDMVQGGELGRIVHTNWIITSWYRAQSYYSNSSWRATWRGEGGGLLLNQNPHNLDLWQWICGMPSRVKADVYYGKHRNIEVEDDVYALFEYPNGAVGSYISTIADEPGTNRLEISGTKGKLVIEDNKIQMVKLSPDLDEFNRTFTGEIGHPEKTKMDIPTEGEYTSHCGIIHNFCDAILTGAPLLAPGMEGIKALEISNGIHLSSWLGSKWIDLPVDGDLFEEMLKEKCGGSLPV